MNGTSTTFNASETADNHIVDVSVITIILSLESVREILHSHNIVCLPGMLLDETGRDMFMLVTTGILRY